MENTYLVEVIVAGVGLLFAAFFKYWPGLRVKFAGLDSTIKKAITIAVLVVVGGIMYGAACIQIWTGLTCDQAGFFELVKVIGTVAVGNQLGYLLLPDVKDARLAKAARQ